MHNSRREDQCYRFKQLHIRLGQILLSDDTKLPVHPVLHFIKSGFSQECVTKAFQKITHGRLNSTDFEPLLAFEENSYGKMWHMCVLNCELNQRCIGFQLCKFTESLFYCMTCCRWKKIKGFTFIAEPGCKFVEKVSNFFSVANESLYCFDYLR